MNGTRNPNYRHGHRVGAQNTRTYKTWCGMITRCTNPRVATYKYYGGRGITVCERWRKFPAFLADMGERPAGTSLDRIDNNGNYEPSNCRWATPKIQVRNTSHNRLLEYRGQRRCIAEWVEITGIPRTTIRGRLRIGWPVARALSTPYRGTIAGECNGQALLTAEDVRRIRRLPNTGYGFFAALAREYRVSPQTIEDAYKGRRWRHL